MELFVDEKFRRKSVGIMLMAEIEDNFRQKGCTVSRVEVFETNIKGHNLYTKLGYAGRIIDMIKNI
jgi:GNAT superfamily N-acetyltransferase